MIFILFMKNIIDEEITIAIHNNVSKNRQRSSRTNISHMYSMKVSRTIREAGGHSVPSGIASEHLRRRNAYNNYDIPSQRERRTGREERRGFRPFR